ncbi:isoamylase early set domain-containing protein [Photobacterium sp. ZSDE20]|uniref:Isoamylase early set domain-containing protein n=1 Tax=Photobacterium pectinilyticum TaxID=2906793 RepID=A0ABT1N6C8_9GAMM|nr:isoamylase early set domain-containing protein [Photobacterium sp. ZSDE20]MCQ1060092.1 isoamylase early set domain-containing protein [Photobacterium sp. ZSDE20]MDD1827271.1 isoamylase early set domain-containing protein [Photobacterium sp. ZSDE20]
MIKKRYFKTKDEVEVTFEWPKGEKTTETVAVSGDFTQWQATPLKLNKKKIFSLKLRLPKDSQYQFRYLINGSQWENDPSADDYIPNGLGSDNGLLSTHSNL